MLRRSCIQGLLKKWIVCDFTSRWHCTAKTYIMNFFYKSDTHGSKNSFVQSKHGVEQEVMLLDHKTLLECHHLEALFVYQQMKA